MSKIFWLENYCNYYGKFSLRLWYSAVIGSHTSFPIIVKIQWTTLFLMSVGLSNRKLHQYGLAMEFVCSSTDLCQKYGFSHENVSTLPGSMLAGDEYEDSDKTSGMCIACGDVMQIFQYIWQSYEVFFTHLSQSGYVSGENKILFKPKEPMLLKLLGQTSGEGENKTRPWQKIIKWKGKKEKKLQQKTVRMTNQSYQVYHIGITRKTKRLISCAFDLFSMSRHMVCWHSATGGSHV